MIMLYKVRQPGTLSLFVIVSALVNFLLLGGNVTLIPPMLAAALVSEAVMKFVKSLVWKGAVFWGVGCFVKHDHQQCGENHIFKQKTDRIHFNGKQHDGNDIGEKRKPLLAQKVR